MSNFSRSKEAKIKRQIYTFSALTLVVLVLLVIWGVPTMIKISEFWWFLGSAGKPPATQTSSDNLPVPPRIAPLEPATNSAKLNISGFAQQGATVEIFSEGSSRGTITTGQDGTFTLSDYTLSTGENTIWAIAKNSQGTKSKQSNTVTIIYDKIPPVLEITTPEAGKIYSSGNREAKITGKTDPNAAVVINDFWAIVNQEGEFTYNFQLADGENSVRVSARDLAGNKTTKEFKLWYNP